MAVTKNVAVMAMFVMAAFVAVCSATDLKNLYVHLSDSDNVEVFKGVNVNNGFGEGKVFDYPVTHNPNTGGLQIVIARAQGLYYQSSNQGKLESYKEDFTILFLDSGAYNGNSFSFSGIWVSGTVHEFPIIGGTGDLAPINGKATLTRVGTSEVYKLEVQQIVGSHYHDFLANRLRA